MQGDVFFAELVARRRDRILDQRQHIDRYRLQAETFRVNLRDLHQIRDQVRQTIIVGLHALQKLPLQRAQNADRLAQQQFGVAHNRTHRRAQFLGNRENHVGVFRHDRLDFLRVFARHILRLMLQQRQFAQRLIEPVAQFLALLRQPLDHLLQRANAICAKLRQTVAVTFRAGQQLIAFGLERGVFRQQAVAVGLQRVLLAAELLLLGIGPVQLKDHVFHFALQNSRLRDQAGALVVPLFARLDQIVAFAAQIVALVGQGFAIRRQAPQISFQCG